MGKTELIGHAKSSAAELGFEIGHHRAVLRAAAAEDNLVGELRDEHSSRAPNRGGGDKTRGRQQVRQARSTTEIADHVVH